VIIFIARILPLELQVPLQDKEQLFVPILMTHLLPHTMMILELFKIAELPDFAHRLI
jgi:hypothetical protein